MERNQMWENLQEPCRPSGFPSAYMLLLAALDTGWNISGPVLMQSVLQNSDQWCYSFVLTNGNTSTSRQLIIPHSRHVEIFIRTQGLVVLDNCC